MAYDPLDPLRNNKDPLHRASEETSREVFRVFGRFCQKNAVPIDCILDAAMNLVVNGIRQTNARRSDAEQRFNYWTGRFRQVLLDQYDGAGNRRNLFPFTQNIEMPHFNDRDRMKR